MYKRQAIIGAGFAGAATAYHLSRCGGEGIVVLEREAVCGLHASGRNAALCRSVADDSHWTALTVRGAALLRNPPADLGDTPLLARGGALLVTSWAATLASVLAQATAFGVPHQLLSRAALRARWPLLAELLAALGASWGLAVQAQATAIDLDGLVQALAELLEDPARAAQLGATGRRRALECYAMPVVAAQLGALWREQVERCAALREAAAAPRRPALQLTLARGFRAMPTRWLDGADAVVLTELGRAALAGAVPIVVGAIPGDAVDSGLLRQLLQRVAREAAWLELAALPDLRAVRHVAWLLKQGYLRQHPPASP